MRKKRRSNGAKTIKATRRVYSTHGSTLINSYRPRKLITRKAGVVKKVGKPVRAVQRDGLKLRLVRMQPIKVGKTNCLKRAADKRRAFFGFLRAKPQTAKSGGSERSKKGGHRGRFTVYC